MSIDVRWADEARTIIHVVFHADWTPSEFYSLDPQTTKMLDKVDHPVYFIIDASDIRGVPRGLNFRLTSRVLTASHPNTELMLIAGLNRYVEAMMNMILRIVPTNTRLKLVTDVDEAYALVATLQDDHDSP